MVAPESTKASVCTLLPYTQSVTGILKEVVLLRAVLLQDSSTTSNFCKLIEGILLSQTAFGHISTNSSTILTVLMATESLWKDLSIDTSHVSKWSVLAEILGRSTGNYYGTIY